MIKGTVSVNWTHKDYADLSYTQKNLIKSSTSVEIVDNTSPNQSNGAFICNENLPSVFTETAKTFGLADTVCAVSRMDPGQYLPFHKDKYPTYIQRNNIQDASKLLRIIVFLHDQKPGHQLWIEDAICMGPAGSYFGWHHNANHMAANLGFESRYVLQITGVSQDE